MMVGALWAYFGIGQNVMTCQCTNFLTELSHGIIAPSFIPLPGAVTTDASGDH